MGVNREQFDVAIIGGGPAGSTLGGLIRKYDPSARVLILEKEKFPREHVGESQLPMIAGVLYELGVWDKVEAAEFPIKIGATYRWGSSPDLWDFNFAPLDLSRPEPRPGKYEGLRRMTAFQVDRAIYDDILLRHAAELGCEVREQTAVADVERDGDRVTALVLAGGERVTATHYADASGHIGILRRAMGVGVTVPTKLMNIAMWDYWENPDWAGRFGAATRVHVLSVGAGWIWVIPVGPTRTSIGFICPAEYYKSRGLRPEQLYLEALAKEPHASSLVASATREGRVRTTKDWSFIADRLTGENWYLVGESAGFADPILSGGLTLAHTGARELAYSILAMNRAEHDPDWLRKAYDERQRRRISQYIRFADFWYQFNGQFTDLEQYSSRIAADAGMKGLTPQQAFRWLSLGGFGQEDFLFPGMGGFDLLAVKQVAKVFTTNEPVGWEINRYNCFRLNLQGTRRFHMPVYNEGRIIRAECLRRAGNLLPLVGLYGLMIDLLRRESDMLRIQQHVVARAKAGKAPFGWNAPMFLSQAMATLEAMLVEGWITGSVNSARPMAPYQHAGAGDQTTHRTSLANVG